jgi:hypothetical protein
MKLRLDADTGAKVHADAEHVIECGPAIARAATVSIGPVSRLAQFDLSQGIQCQLSFRAVLGNRTQLAAHREASVAKCRGPPALQLRNAPKTG